MRKILNKIKKRITNNIFSSLFVFSLIIIFGFYYFFYSFIIPELKQKFIEEKKDFLHIITHTVEIILKNKLESNEEEKNINEFISKFNYWGNTNKYFFLIDGNNKIIAHPNSELINLDVNTLKDINNYELWKEILNISKTSGDWYLSYIWTQKDDSTIQKAKITYITTFWEEKRILATGLFIDDVEKNINNIIWSVIKYTIINILLIIIVLLIIVRIWTKIENDKRKIKKEYSSLVHNLSIWVFRLSTWKKVHPVMWNESMLRLFWLTDKEMWKDGVCFGDFIKNKNVQETFIKDIIEKKPLTKKEIEIVNNKWENLWINIEWNITEEKDWVYFDWLAEDITETHKIHELLKKSYKKLQKVDWMKNDIIWITSHELRTPLTIIKWFWSILKNNKVWPLNPEQTKYVDKITNNTDKLLSMVNDMLDLSKLEAWEEVFVAEEINIRKFIMQIYEDFVLESKDEHKIINIDLIDEDIIIEYDYIQLKRVIINLISNAMKFVNQEEWVINIVVEKKNDDIVEIKIIDNWKWIAEENISDIFVKFKQVWWHMKRMSEWTGLWLPIVKTILKQMGSWIKVKSVLWEWSEFYFDLKIKK